MAKKIIFFFKEKWLIEKKIREEERGVTARHFSKN